MSDTKKSSRPGSVPPGLQDSDLPALFRASDLASRGGQRRYMRAMGVQIFLLLLAGGAGLLGYKVGNPPVDVGAAISASAFLCAAVLAAFILQSGPDKIWFEGRAAAESVKTLSWRYSVGGEPFNIGLPDEDVDRAFLDGISNVLTDLARLTIELAEDEGDQITPAMRSLREAPQADRRAAYINGRIEQQRRWYSSKGHWNARRSQQWGVALLLLEAVGGTAAVLKVSGLPIISLMSLAAGAAVGVTSWTQAKQHRALASAYAIAAQELASIKARVPTQHTEAQWAQFVADAEGAISREHTLWSASRGHRVKPSDPAKGHYI